MNSNMYNKIISEMTLSQFQCVERTFMKLWWDNTHYTDNMLRAISYKLLVALGEEGYDTGR